METKTKPTKFVLFKDRRFLLFVASLVFAFLAAVLFQVYLAVRVESATGGDMREVMVAAGDLPEGTVLKPEHFSLAERPAKYVTSRNVLGKYSNFLEGQHLAVSLQQGQPFVWSDIAFSDRRGFAENVPIHRRAIAVSVDALNSFNGRLEPGNRVDIYCEKRGEGMGGSSTELVLQNARILAVGTQVRPSSHLLTHESQGNAPNVTFELAPDEIPRLMQAEAEGRIVFALRNPSDIFTRAHLHAASSGSAAPPSASNPPLKNKHGERDLSKIPVGDFPEVFVEGQMRRNGFFFGPKTVTEELRQMDASSLHQDALDLLQRSSMKTDENENP